MNNTESWKKYVPETVSLYHVDYRENLDEREDLQEQCIRNNNMERLYETVMECYAEQEAESLLKILGEIKEKMAEEKRQEEFEEHREEITDLILSRSDADPAEELIKNSAAINMYYSPGAKIEEHIGKESRAMSCYKVRRALKLKKGQFDTLIEELVDNATYGGELRIYFNAGFNELVTNDNGKDFRTIRFHGDVIVAVANSFNGSGYHISLPLDITFPFVRDRLFVDSQVRYSYATEVCGMCRDWCDSTSWKTEYKTVRNTGRNREKEKTLSTN